MGLDLYAFEMLTGRRLVPLPISSGSWSIATNADDTISCSIPARAAVTELLDVWGSTPLARTGLLAVVDDEPVAAGPLWKRKYGQGKAIEFTAGGLRSYWERRLLLPVAARTNSLVDPVTGDPDPAYDTNLAGLSYGTIAKRYIELGLLWPGGNIPMLLPPDEAGTRERNVAAIELKKIRALVDALSNVQNGPDIAFRPRWAADGLGIYWEMQHGSEAAPRLGGHTNTVDVTLDGKTHPVDTGFLVFNEKTYPNLIALFDTLGVESVQTEMSFAVSLENPDIEWAGSSLATVFGQKRNLLRPAFWTMLSDILRFNRESTAWLTVHPGDERPLGDFLKEGRYSDAFADWYLLPMAAAIWSCPTAQMRDMPLATFVRFCQNHGLLQIFDRPMWRTVRGGGREYVNKIAAQLDDLSAAIQAALRESLEDFGLRLVNFYVSGIDVQDGDASLETLRAALAKRAEMSIVGYTYQQERSLNALEGAAGFTAADRGLESGGNNIAAAAMGLGVGFGAGAPIGSALGTQMAQVVTPQLAAQAAPAPVLAAPAGSVACPKCQAPVAATARFCPACGGGMAPPATPCAGCGAPLGPGAAFCAQCGAAVQAACRQCGAKLAPGARFCGECGTPRSGAPAGGAA